MSTTDDWFTAPIPMQRVLTAPFDEVFPTADLPLWAGKPPVPSQVGRTRRSPLAWIKDEALPAAVIGSVIIGISWTMAQFVGAA